MSSHSSHSPESDRLDPHRGDVVAQDGDIVSYLIHLELEIRRLQALIQPHDDLVNDYQSRLSIALAEGTDPGRNT